MIIKRRFWVLPALMVLLLVTMLVGCTDKKQKTTTQVETETSAKSGYNVTDIAVLVGKDTENGRLSLKSKDTGSIYSVNYNGGTKIKSKYGNDIILDKVEVGTIVEAHYIEGTRKLVEMLVSDEAWENTMATKIDVDYDKRILTIGSTNYSYDENLFVYSNGRELDIRELSGIDELTVRGYGTKALSIVVNKGHGYVRLINDNNYVDGMIEIGTSIMTTVIDDMIIAVPEGEHTLVVSKNGVGGEKGITVERGMETIVSLTEFEQPVERVGSVNFNITPEDADALLYIDNVLVDYDELVTLTYGKHSLIITSNEYDTYQKTITISSVYSTVSINISGEEETEDETEESTTSDEEETTAVADVEDLDDGDESINVNAPEGAYVYFDGVYKGVAPVSFSKVSGEHVIILSKDGYETKMYTIDVVSDGEDMDVSFPDMLESE